MMNNKGFTLIEVLSVLILVSIVAVIVFTTFGTTMSASKETSYKLMKNNIVAAGYDYINECNLGIIGCDFSFETNNKFKARVLQSTGFFNNLESPIDGKDLGSCLVLEATKSNGVVVINLIDNCYDETDNFLNGSDSESTVKDKNAKDKNKNNKDKTNKNKVDKDKVYNKDKV